MIEQKRRKTLVSMVLLVHFCGGAANAGAAQSSKESWRVDSASGETQVQAQHFAEAEQDFRKALSEVVKEPHTLVDEIQCISQLADVLTLRDKTEEAGGLYRRSLALLESKYGKESPKIVPALFSLGAIYESAGDHSAAMTYYQRAMHINQKHYGPYSPGVAVSLHYMGKASLSAGNKTQAEKQYKQSLAILMQQPSLSSSDQMEKLLADYHDLLKNDDHENTDLLADFKQDILEKQKKQFSAATTSPRSQPDNISPKQVSEGASTSASVAQTPDAANQADSEVKLRPAVQQNSTDVQPAKSHFENANSFRLNAIRQKQTDADPLVMTRGFEQPLTKSELGAAYSTIDDVLSQQNHYQESELFHQRKIAIDIKALGGSHPSVANDLTSLALLYISQHRYREAEPLLMRAVKIYENVYGENNVLVMKTRATLASVEYYEGNVEQAAQLYRSALSAGIDEPGANNVQTARILNELAFLYYQQGKLQESATFYDWALSSTRAAVGDSNPLVAACMRDYARVLRALGKQSEATEMETKADVILAQR